MNRIDKIWILIISCAALLAVLSGYCATDFMRYIALIFSAALFLAGILIAVKSIVDGWNLHR